MAFKVTVSLLGLIALTAAAPTFFKGLGFHGGHEHHIIHVPYHVPDRIHDINHRHVEKVHVPYVHKVHFHDHLDLHDHHHDLLDHHHHHDHHLNLHEFDHHIDHHDHHLGHQLEHHGHHFDSLW